MLFLPSYGTNYDKTTITASTFVTILSTGNFSKKLVVTVYFVNAQMTPFLHLNARLKFNLVRLSVGGSLR